MFKVLILILLSYSPGAGATSQARPCDLTIEKTLEKKNSECDKRKTKSTKQWPSLEIAKAEVLGALKSGDATKLAAYIGCDAGFSTKLDTICEPDLPEIGLKELKQVISLLKDSSPSVLTFGQWVNYGTDKDIYVYCSGDSKISVAKNYCDKTGKLQPIIEIKRADSKYYIYGLPELSGH